MLTKALVACAFALCACVLSLLFLADESAMAAIAPTGAAGIASAALFPGWESLVAAKHVAANGYFQCAVTSGGRVMCWGDSSSGQVGNGGPTTAYTVPQDASGLSGGVVSLKLGYSHACAILNNGAKCWGSNSKGELGSGTSGNSAVPLDVTVLPTVPNEFALGYNFTCARLAGSVLCWGNNVSGQLGNGTTANSTIPVSVTGLAGNVTAIAAGNSHVCAILEAGTVQCWGANLNGQLGIGSTINYSRPMTVTGLLGVGAISGGIDHTCALLLTGGLKCWGYNNYGQLGDGTNSRKLTPVPVSGLAAGVSAVDAGSQNTCALLTTGSVVCWGNNAAGQLGTGTTTNSWVPTDVVGLASSATALATGDRHSCVTLAIGGIQCWGENSTGAVGDGTMLIKLVPTHTIGFGNDPVTGLTRIASPGTVISGDIVTYTVTFSNGTPYVGLLTVVTDTLPPGGTFVTTTAASDINVSNSSVSPSGSGLALRTSAATSSGNLVWQASSYYTVAPNSSISLQYLAIVTSSTGTYASTTCGDSFYTRTMCATNTLDVSVPTAVTLERMEAEVEVARPFDWNVPLIAGTISILFAIAWAWRRGGSH